MCRGSCGSICCTDRVYTASIGSQRNLETWSSAQRRFVIIWYDGGPTCSTQPILRAKAIRELREFSPIRSDDE